MATFTDLPKKELAIHKWDAIAVTCETVNLASLIQEDLDQLQTAGLISADTLLLAVEDPRPDIGSGGATINALLLICEHFCVREDLSVLNVDILLNKRLLIIHSGRKFSYESLGGMFLRLPCHYKKNVAIDFPVTNFHWIYQLLTEKITPSSFSGVWVCSGDMVIDSADPFDITNNIQNEVIAFSFPASEEVALRNGIYDVDEHGYLEDIVYKGSLQRIRQCGQATSDGDQKCYPLVTGLVYFPLWIAEKLLALYSQPPLSACTYMGVDSGVPPVKVSLFFDILASMNNKQKTNSNDHPTGYRIMRQKLQSCRCKIVYQRNAQCVYMSSSARETWNGIVDLCKRPSQKRFDFEENMITSNAPWFDENLTFEDTKFISSIQNSDWNVVHPRFLHEGRFTTVWVVYPDDIMLQSSVDQELKLGRETFREFSSRTRIVREDLWMAAETPSFSNARLFPIAWETENNNISLLALLSWFFIPGSQGVSEATLMTWHRSKRVSFHEIIRSVDVKDEYCFRKNMTVAKTKQRIGEVLSTPHGKSSLCDVGLRPLLRWFVCIKEAQDLLVFLDQLAVKLSNHPGQVARVLATIADLLGAMACKRGCLRSGPAMNHRWINAFASLRAGNIARGIEMLVAERCNWLHTPDQLIRAGRHFERASQILISQAVLTSKENISTVRHAELCGKYKEIVVDCPARIDISGGWSDTPPICYENGGTVVNISISVNNQLPIGARVQQIDEPIFQFETQDSKVIIRTAEDLSDYDNPTSPGALIKATLVFANMTPPLTRSDGTKFGLRISTWSNLPHGSGLGTSSIMSAGLLTALWIMDGWTFTDSDVIHGVLTVEQLMTTGGGWQDQVGGIGKGIQVCSSGTGLPLSVVVDQLNLDAHVMTQLNDRLILLYSGKTRLAKNLLQDVIRNWYARDAVISQNVKDLVTNAVNCRTALVSGDLNDVGECINNYWAQKKVMAPGSEPLTVSKLMAAIKPLMSCMALAGAGGGGFLIGLLKPGATHLQLEEEVKKLKTDNPDLETYQCGIHVGGLKITKV